MEIAVAVILTGVGATLVMDSGSLLRRSLTGAALPNYAFVGRWISHLAQGRVHHRSIAAAPVVRGELAVGWLVHYLTGIIFAALLLAAVGADWFARPTPVPALLTGLATVLAPFLVMQPAMGAGFAASRTPRPAAARLQSLFNHAIFGLGLYLAALVLSY